ncbi:MBL fold metallo-hydrolase [Planococcus sp. CP5-4]|uniref:MBL fold metallo-hydrolase n=1 Tax=unclassified Planococcus (in: firmicutes) TaxID=2662419 RepID=UPI001C2307F4|nr:MULTISPECIES: MBL fold metallo-hydrolase [unclassified Planococcus (in: firmicutes)]MBU9674389.1 MBL fold metallo-hydrolase [Planococcus sp. CP5-4_YE]MBV0909023.1 MBL fold metallo-hydrolase [Planococcus sp. CP5-4_UN]MBW6065081.1 MBL fold metallo-hydrolase [Planococcus sp. CP5-4]
MAISKLNDRIQLIDGFDLGLEQRTGSYVIMEQQLTIIETGPSPSVEHVKQGLNELGISLDEVRYIIVTHIHLDHAGGAGLLLRDCPNATLIVHPKGARHLADPSRLIAGARAVYGGQFDDLFNPIVPVPEHRIAIKTEGDRLQIGPDCTLEFWDTPGHAKHHFGILDPVSNGFFAGDTAGIRYAQLIEDGIDFYLPSTSPNQFDPEAMKASIERMQRQQLDVLYFGHFGAAHNPAAALEQVLEWLELFVEEGAAAYQNKESADQLAKRLLTPVMAQLAEKGAKQPHRVMPYIEMDLQVSAQGLLDYFHRQG